MAAEGKKKTRRFTFQFGWGGLLGGSFAATLVLAWIFVLGILVGRGSIPNPFQLPFLEKLNLLPATKSMPAVTTPDLPQPATPAPDKNPKGKTAPEKTPEVKLDFFHSLDNKRPVVTGVVPRESSGGKKSTGVYTVQIASFRDGEKAQTFLEQMAGKNIDCYISPTKSKNVLWYRIRTGRYNDLDEARAVVADLKEKYRMEALAVKIE